MEKKFDVIIIGSGPGGYPAAIRLAQAGRSVALVEAKEVGGTCLNCGCIPTKALIANAETLSMVRHAQNFGIGVDGVHVHFDQMIKRKDDVVGRLRKSLEGLIQSNMVTIVRGFGKLISKNQVEVNEGVAKTILSAPHIIIATGSEPKEIPTFAFDDHFIHSSTSILNLKMLPKKIAIVGAGVVGCEFASLYAELGTEVFLIEALPRILPLESQTISQALMHFFTKKGIHVSVGTGVKGIEKRPEGITVVMQNQEKMSADIALVAVGRALNSQNIGLDTAGVRVEKGAICVDETMQTNVPGIWAIGDVTAKSMYAHVASHQGLVAAESILGHRARMNYDAVPGVIFTHPEIGTVGMNIETAKQRGYDASVAAYPFQALGKAQAALQTEGFAQLVVDKKTGQILGGQVIGHEASNLIATITLAITNELTIESITETIHAHPTLSEAWLESAFLIQGTPLHFPQKPKIGEKCK